MNVSDRIVRSSDDITPNVRWREYEHSDMFEFVGRLHATNNMLIIDDMYNQYLYNTAEGLVYCFVVDGILFKIGQTSTTMRKRIKSYNCGQPAYRKNGTCSVTNYFILSSLVSMYESGSDIMLYIWKAYDSVTKTAFGGKRCQQCHFRKTERGRADLRFRGTIRLCALWLRSALVRYVPCGIIELKIWC